jgi:hypothetical protein
MASVKGFDSLADNFFGDFLEDLSQEFSANYRASNIIEFLETEVDIESWLGPGGKLNERQIILLKTYDGLPLTESEIAYIQAWRALDRTTYDLEMGPRKRQSFVLESGRGSGKTFLGAVIIGYEWYRLCMLPNPQQFFGVASSTLISIYCLAPAASQVKKTIFGQARAFLNYIPKVKRLIDNKDIIIGEEEIKYHDKLLYIYAGNSKGSSQVGSRVILLVMDEVARFENKDGKSNALELWSNVGVSGITFGEHARRVAISSAWREGDAIQRLYTAAKAEDSWIGFRFRTWDVNPTMDRNNSIVASEYVLNPASARLEFEGDRTTSAYTYFSENEVLAATVGRSVIKIEPMQAMPDKMVRLQLSSIEKDYSHPTYMHLDPAFVKDAYAMAFGHGERRDDQDVVVIDGLAAWEPEGGSVVSIINVYDIITTIHAARPIHKLTTDHAQQHETIQRLRLLGINASSRFWSNRVQVEIYDFTRKLVHEGRLILPKDSYWTALLKSEMMGIIYDTERGKINHPPDGTKDLIDAVASVAWEIAGAPTAAKALPRMVGRPSVMKSKVRDWGSDSQRRSLVRQARTKGHGFSDDFDDGGFGF